jgi:hypothetical protein
LQKANTLLHVWHWALGWVFDCQVMQFFSSPITLECSSFFHILVVVDLALVPEVDYHDSLAELIK